MLLVCRVREFEDYACIVPTYLSFVTPFPCPLIDDAAYHVCLFVLPCHACAHTSPKAFRMAVPQSRSSQVQSGSIQPCLCPNKTPKHQTTKKKLQFTMYPDAGPANIMPCYAIPSSLACSLTLALIFFTNTSLLGKEPDSGSCRWRPCSASDRASSPTVAAGTVAS